MESLTQLAAATFGSAAFAAYFNLHGKKLAFATVGGFLSWGIYLLTVHFFPYVYLGGFIASAVATIYAECMARIQKSPVTVFLVSAAIPLFPGGALYTALNCLIQKNLPEFTEQGTYALLFAVSMSAGITCTTVIFQIVMSHLGHIRRA